MNDFNRVTNVHVRKAPDLHPLLHALTTASRHPIIKFDGLTLCAQDLHVQVCQTTGRRESQLDHALDGDGVVVQVVKQGTVLVVV